MAAGASLASQAQVRGQGKPRYRFCWHCDGKLWGNKHHVLETHGGEVTLHAECAKELKESGEAWEPSN